MPVSCVENGSVLTVRVAGEVDHHAARALMNELGRQVDTVLPGELVLDMGGVTFMDSSGIAVVLRTWKRMEEVGGKMRLMGVPSQAGKVLKAAGIDRLIPFTD